MALTNRKGLLQLLLCWMLLTFHPLPVQAAGMDSEAVAENSAPPASQSVGTEGLAAYYARRYEGRMTNSGERYQK
jgi:peptidoglycan lytic transglycosylase